MILKYRLAVGVFVFCVLDGMACTAGTETDAAMRDIQRLQTNYMKGKTDIKQNEVEIIAFIEDHAADVYAHTAVGKAKQLLALVYEKEGKIAEAALVYNEILEKFADDEQLASQAVRSGASLQVILVHDAPAASREKAIQSLIPIRDKAIKLAHWLDAYQVSMALADIHAQQNRVAVAAKMWDPLIRALREPPATRPLGSTTKTSLVGSLAGQPAATSGPSLAASKGGQMQQRVLKDALAARGRLSYGYTIQYVSAKPTLEDNSAKLVERIRTGIAKDIETIGSGIPPIWTPESDHSKIAPDPKKVATYLAGDGFTLLEQELTFWHDIMIDDPNMVPNEIKAVLAAAGEAAGAVSLPTK